ncbi:DUF4337 domain-containing protein [Acetonema longum]|uniref:DUF4337 domain-containing protein n=1 Tax=Acetonema longum DSM 6540 TaxID=1009370 RepID=F7NNI1_9FIRM|nr:DUF4337 domain-containing protein [Acetonema longum]EGO62422.1 hypothetical protein ALO_18360 [Acetonema longum DSM 6540]
MADREEQGLTETSAKKNDQTADRRVRLMTTTTMVLAVCSTLASFRAANCGHNMLMAQSQLANQWAYYQAKSIKETAYQAQKQALEIWLRHSERPEYYQETITQFAAETERYAREKQEIAEKAARWEEMRADAENFFAVYGKALIFLQMGVLLSSLASVNKAAYFSYTAFICGGIGVIIFLYGLVKSG